LNARERFLTCACGGILRIVLDFDLFDLTDRVVVYDQLERMKLGHAAASAAVKVVTLEVLEHLDIRYPIRP